MPNTDNKLVQAMLDPGFYNHPVDQVRLIETHISWVFLTGQFAYKVKKPVDFGFLDFTKLEKRQYYCEEELRLNRRLAPEIYLDVIPITESGGTFHFNDSTRVIEYVVEMKEFDQHCLLEHLLDNKQLTFRHMQQLADKLAEFHSNIAMIFNNIKFVFFR